MKRSHEFLNMLAALAIACSFLTTLPAPRVDWTPRRLRYVPLAIPLVGVVVGALGELMFSALSFWKASYALRGVIMTLFYLALTGGLHMDGLMDTCDAIFSRKGRKERLEILSDTHVGAFAVMGCAAVLMLKAGIFFEMFASSFIYSGLLALIPVYSRLGLGLLFFLPFAKEDGLARTLGAARVPRDRFLLWIGYAFFGILGMLAAWPLGLKCLFVPITGVISLVLYGRCCVRIFGGVTGDLMGAYAELSEVLMLLTLVIVKQAGG